MRTISQYMDAAKTNQSITTDADLARALTITTAGIAHWRTGKSWPADHYMVDLAKLADMDPVEAVLDLNRWRAKEKRAANVYRQALKRVQAAATAAAIIGVVSIGLPGVLATDARASEQQENNHALSPRELYIIGGMPWPEGVLPGKG